MNNNKTIWKSKILGDFVSLQRGHDLTNEERKNGNIPVYGAAGQNGFHNKAITKAPGIVVGRCGGSFGQVHFVKQDYWPHNTALYVTDFKGNDPYFAYYLLKTLNFNALNSGSAQPSLNRNYLYPIIIKVPEPIVQKSIASTLSSLDSKIELNNHINTELDAIAKTIYDYWFVQFDFPNNEGKPYKRSGGKMVWNEELKKEIPEGWKDGTLSDISDLIRGVSYDANDIKSESDEDVIPILRATNISGNVIDLNNMVYVPSTNVSSKQLLKKFDILITMSSGSKEHIGKNGFFYFDKEVSFGAFCAKLVAKDEFQFYLYSYTQSDFMFNTIKNECLGTNINNLNSSLVKGFKIIIPPKELIKEFNKIAFQLYEKFGNNYKENQQLSSLRDWLLPMLMNGQVRPLAPKGEQEMERLMAAEPRVRYGE